MKIAIVGTAPSSRLLAPYNDPEWEIWATGPGSSGILPKVDVWFELHSLDRIFNDPSEKDYLARLTKEPRVYTQKVDPRIPGSVAYPKDEMVARHGPWFFTSSVAWMLALALDKKPEAVGCFGVDMAAIGEFADQKPACLYFLQLIERAGIPVIVPPESDLLCPPPLYGFCEDYPMYRKFVARRNEIVGRINALKQQRISISTDEAKLLGALEDIEYTQQTWAGSAQK